MAQAAAYTANESSMSRMRDSGQSSSVAAALFVSGLRVPASYLKRHSGPEHCHGQWHYVRHRVAVTTGGVSLHVHW
jgi:hypothetical protein